MNDEDRRIIEAMQTYGGSFVKVLAQAAQLADSENLDRIKCAFPDYWEKYMIMADRIQDEKELTS